MDVVPTNAKEVPISYSVSKLKEKRVEIRLSPMTNAPTPAEMSKGQSDNTSNAKKSSITQRLRTDLGRSVGVTTATQLVWSAVQNHEKFYRNSWGLCNAQFAWGDTYCLGERLLFAVNTSYNSSMRLFDEHVNVYTCMWVRCFLNWYFMKYLLDRNAECRWSSWKGTHPHNTFF